MNSFLLLVFLWETDVISSQDSLLTGGKMEDDTGEGVLSCWM